MMSQPKKPDAFPSEFHVALGEHMTRFAVLLPMADRALFYRSCAELANAQHADLCLTLDTLTSAAARVTALGRSRP